MVEVVKGESDWREKGKKRRSGVEGNGGFWGKGRIKGTETGAREGQGGQKLGGGLEGK